MQTTDTALKNESPKSSDSKKSFLGGTRDFLVKYPVVVVLLGAIIGIAIGAGLSQWDTESTDKDVTLKWIGLIGDLYLRSLKAIVLPLIFVSVVLAVMEMMTVGRASSVGWKTVVLYVTTTLVASVIAVIAIVIFKDLFKKGAVAEPDAVQITLGCLNQEGSLLSQLDNGSVQCIVPDGANEEPLDSHMFVFTDVSGTLSQEQSGPEDEISLSDTIYEGIFEKLVTDNIFMSFNDGSFAAVVFFAIFFGVAFGQYITGNKIEPELSALMRVMKEVEGTLVQLVQWVIVVTPIAVLSLIAQAIGNQENLKEAFSNVGYLILATFVADILHILVVHIGMLGAVLRENPLKYLRHLTEAQSLALACASSAATLPMTLKCIMKSGYVPPAVAKFVAPLGATMNMDGSAIYFPCACVWLAVLNGIEPDISQYILLIILASVGSAGTAPVPSAQLVLIITAYNTVFDAKGTPAGFEFIIAIDWLIDRTITALNVTGDCAVSAMVAKWAHMDELDVSDVESGSEKVNGKEVESAVVAVEPNSNQ